MKGLFARLKSFWEKQIDKPYRQKQIPDHEALLITGAFCILGAALILGIPSLMPKFEDPFPYFKFVTGFALLLGGLVLIIPSSSIVSGLGHVVASVGIGLMAASAEASDLVDTSVMPLIKIITACLVTVGLISVFWPMLLRSFLAALVGVVLFIPLAAYESLSAELTIMGFSVILGVIWSWQELLSGNLTVNEAIDTATKTYIRIVRLLWRRILAVSYKEKRPLWTQVSDTLVVMQPSNGKLRVNLAFEGGDSESALDLGEFSSVALDLSGNAFSEQPNLKTYRGVTKVAITSPGFEGAYTDLPKNTAFLLLSE